MPYNPDIHHRRSIRLKDYDYASPGAYFVTVDVFQRECLLGELRNGEVILSEAGTLVRKTWDQLPERFSYIELDEFCIMPDHIHGIIWIKETGTRDQTLSHVIRGFKSISAVVVNRQLHRQGIPLWHRNYYDRIIRDEDELSQIRLYIRENPLRWELS